MNKLAIHITLLIAITLTVTACSGQTETRQPKRVATVPFDSSKHSPDKQNKIILISGEAYLYLDAAGRLARCRLDGGRRFFAEEFIGEDLARSLLSLSIESVAHQPMPIHFYSRDMKGTEKKPDYYPYFRDPEGKISKAVWEGAGKTLEQEVKSEQLVQIYLPRERGLLPKSRRFNGYVFLVDGYAPEWQTLSPEKRIQMWRHWVERQLPGKPTLIDAPKNHRLSSTESLQNEKTKENVSWMKEIPSPSPWTQRMLIDHNGVGVLQKFQTNLPIHEFKPKVVEERLEIPQAQFDLSQRPALSGSLAIDDRVVEIVSPNLDFLYLSLPGKQVQRLKLEESLLELFTQAELSPEGSLELAQFRSEGLEPLQQLEYLTPGEPENRRYSLPPEQSKKLKQLLREALPKNRRGTP